MVLKQVSILTTTVDVYTEHVANNSSPWQYLLSGRTLEVVAKTNSKISDVTTSSIPIKDLNYMHVEGNFPLFNQRESLMVIYTVDLRLSKHHALTTKLFNSETDNHVFNMEEKLMYTKNASAMIDLVG